MKKIYSTIMMLAMMVAALSFTACGDDDDDTPETSICGIWKCVSANYGEWEGYMEDETRVGDILYLNEDHTFNVNNNNGTWSLSGNTLTLNSGIPVSYKITQLTASTLSVTLKEMGISLSFSKQ